MERPRLLVVDDDSYTRHALHALFSRRGWDVGLASTVAEGLSLLEDCPRCIILDLNLPDGGGETILREVRRKLPGTMVAVCSGCQDPVQLAVVRGLQPELLLCKPVDVTPIENFCLSAMAS